MSAELNYDSTNSQTYNSIMSEMRKNKLGFYPQREKLYNHYLPYSQQIDDEIVQYLSHIKANISRSLILNDWNAISGFSWIEELSNYISLYGLCFSKEDHIYFIKLLLNVITIPQLCFQEVIFYSRILIKLLKKKELISPEELVIPWRPLYELFKKTDDSKYKDLGMILIPKDYESVITELIRKCRIYFPIESTQEMLDEWRPYLCPYDTMMSKAMTYFDIFMPTLMMPKNYNQGFKLWFEEFMTIWKSCQNKPSWEWRIISLFSRLASDTIGFIDWNPFIPTIFTILKNGLIGKSYVYHDVVLWLISMIGPNSVCQKYITKLFKSVKTYYYPSNAGEITDRLHSIMSSFLIEFSQRLHQERYADKSWIPTVPEDHRLREEDITEFSECLIDIVMISMFSPSGCSDSEICLRHLAQLRPEIVIPKVFKELNTSLDILTEPHRLEASIKCVTAILPTYLKRNKLYTEYDNELMPLLMPLLRGLDVNDMQKSKDIFRLFEVFATLVPLNDCSSILSNEMSGFEAQLCLSTSGFDSFVLELIDNCFELIENNSSVNTYRFDKSSNNSMTDEEWAVYFGIKNTLCRILSGISPKLFENCLNKIFDFVSNHLFDTNASIDLTAALLKICSEINAKLTLQKFIPNFCNKILEMIENNDILEEESVDTHFLYYFQLLNGLVECDGSHLLDYEEFIFKVFDKTLNVKCAEIYEISSYSLKLTLKSLTSIYELEFYMNSRNSGIEKIKNWGKTFDLSEVELKWHVPNDNEIEFAQKLLERYLRICLNQLKEWTEGNISLTKEELRRNLYIIDDCILGASNVLPFWSEEDMNLSDSLISMCFSPVKCVGSKSISFSNDENIREVVLKTLHSVLNHMMSVCEDNTKSFGLIIRLYRNILFHFGISETIYSADESIYRSRKVIFGNKILKDKRHIRSVLIKRIALQHELRVNFAKNLNFTKFHEIIMRDLLLLSTSHYDGVRLLARNELFDFFSHFPNSHRLILPDILRHLNKAQNSNDEQLEGSLFLTTDVYGTKKFSLLTNSDWISMSQLWPALVNSKPSEKQTIVDLLKHILYQVQSRFFTLTLSLNIPDICVDYAKKIWTENKSLPKPAFECPSDQKISEALEKAEKRNQMNLNSYNEIVENLVLLIEDQKMHWRYNDLAFNLLKQLIRHDISYPLKAIKLFTKSLINEKQLIRKLTIDSMLAILKQLKNINKKHELKTLPKDNQWLQTEMNFDFENQNVYNTTDFVDKAYRGFYSYEKPFLVYDRNVSTLRKFSDKEILIRDTFMDKDFINKLLTYLTLEENKGCETFNVKISKIFKGLFKLFGPIYLEKLLPKISEHLNGSNDSEHRFAAEFTYGLIRGSKHWSFDELMKMRELLEPMIRNMFNNLTKETFGIWGSFTANLFGNWDPKRLLWIFRIYFDDPLKEGSDSLSSFDQFSKLYLLHSAVGELEWKGLSISNDLLNYFETKHLNHIYQDIRRMIGSFLCSIFKFDDNVPCLPNTLQLAPKRSDFVDRILPRLQILLNSETDKTNDEIQLNNERKDAINLLKTICIWIDRTTNNSPNSAPKELFKFIPFLCLMNNDMNDEELAEMTEIALVSLMRLIISKEGIEMALNILKEVSLSNNWHSRQEIAFLVLTLVSSNLFTLISNELWINEINELVLNLLKDEKCEVRETAEKTLNSLMHCELIAINNKLIKSFRQNANHSIFKSLQQNGLKSVDFKDMAIKHSGILGLCACINAFPYEVPYFIPDIILFLTEHLNDPQPIPKTIRKTLSDFKRIHSDNWREHKENFTEYQLSIISDLSISPSYYA